MAIHMTTMWIWVIHTKRMWIKWFHDRILWIRMIHRFFLWNPGLGENPGFTNTLGSPVSLDLKYIIAQAQAVSTWAV